jgi:hypothetical protein
MGLAEYPYRVLKQQVPRQQTTFGQRPAMDVGRNPMPGRGSSDSDLMRLTKIEACKNLDGLQKSRETL